GTGKSCKVHLVVFPKENAGTGFLANDDDVHYVRSPGRATWTTGGGTEAKTSGDGRDPKRRPAGGASSTLSPSFALLAPLRAPSGACLDTGLSGQTSVPLCVRTGGP
ncbi:hypothetical protein, partial [Streptomyces sp. NPDC059656]|uniref:hypothetical protein n=1 Tax=Streptomyces sp. NPDC059656 TaxID=3346898 RepID=UPI0036A2DCFE